jgi:4-amino-4-deoxy-L-arabinose transferase-like glycosyltransferase
VLITLLAAILRLYSLDRLPPGLYHDEAFNGLDALGVIAGQRPVFFEANNGREPLFIYLAAASVSLLGRSPIAVRLVAALLGTLTVPATYTMARECLGRRAALLTALVTAITFWHVNLSRIGFRAVGLPLFSALTLLFLARALQRGQLSDFAVSGLFLGLSFYTYLAARFLPLVLIVWIVVTVLRRQQVNWPGYGVLLAVALLIALPLLALAVQNWDVFLSRSMQVSIWNPAIHQGDPLGALLQNVIGALGMFNLRGDFIPRHNMPHRPVFDAAIGLAFLIGLVVCVRGARDDSRRGLLLVFLLVMLAPTVMAEGAPHFLRGAGVLPVLFVFPALGLIWVFDALAARTPKTVALLAVVMLLGWSLYMTVSDYYQHSQSEAAYYNFESGAAELASEINVFRGSGWHDGLGLLVPEHTPISGHRVYLDDRLWRDWASLRYLVPETGGLTLLSKVGSAPRVPAPDRVRLVVWPYDDYSSFLSLLPPDSVISVREGPLERGDLEVEARLLCVVYEASTDVAVPDNLRAQLQQGITLLGYRWQATAEGPKLCLYWQAARTVQDDYTVFVHWSRDGTMIAQSDALPARGYYSTDLWRSGDMVEDPHLLATPAIPLPGEGVSVGMYSLQTMTRLQVLDAPGAPIADHITIELPQM